MYNRDGNSIVMYVNILVIKSVEHGSLTNRISYFKGWEAHILIK